MGRDKNESKLYIIDYGLAKKYRSSSTKQHLPFKTHKKLTGTARYASINALKGCGKLLVFNSLIIIIEQSRRDDIEAIGYIFIYFLLGILPWQNLKINYNEDRYKKICEVKASISTEELCKGLHRKSSLNSLINMNISFFTLLFTIYIANFITYLNYAKSLKFVEEPNYKYLQNLLLEILIQEKLPFNHEYEWLIKSKITSGKNPYGNDEEEDIVK